MGAGEQRREHHVFAVLFRIHVGHHGQTFGQMQCGLEALREALGLIRPHSQSVDDDFDRVLLVLVEFGRIVDFTDQSVDSRTDKAAGAQLVEHVYVFALAIAHHGRKQHHPRAFRQGQHLIDHLAYCLGFELDLVFGTERLPRPGEQQPQIIVNLGDGADC